MAHESTLRGVGAWALAGGICGVVFAATTVTIGLAPHPLSPTTDEIRALFDTRPLLGFLIYIVGGTIIGGGYGVIR